MSKADLDEALKEAQENDEAPRQGDLAEYEYNTGGVCVLKSVVISKVEMHQQRYEATPSLRVWLDKDPKYFKGHTDKNWVLERKPNGSRHALMKLRRLDQKRHEERCHQDNVEAERKKILSLLPWASLERLRLAREILEPRTE